MREESLVLQYRNLQRQETKALSENAWTVLDAPVRKMNELIEGHTDTDLLKEITKVTEPVLEKYLKGFRPFRERQLRRERLLQGLKIASEEELKTVSPSAIDRYVKGLVQKGGLFVSLTGGIGAVGGIAVALMELPVLLNTTFETLEGICEAYGHDPYDYFEKLYLLMVVLFALIPDEESRRAVYAKMKLIETWMSQSDIPIQEREAFYPPQEAAAFCAGYLAQALVVNRVYQAVPVAGALLGASLNFDFLSRLGRNSQVFYKRRFLESRLGLIP